MEKSKELEPFIKVAKSSLGANGSKPVPYHEFVRAYKKDSNGKDFEKEAKNAGFKNGRNALAFYPEIFRLNGNEVQRIDNRDITHITSAVDQSKSKKRQKKSILSKSSVPASRLNHNDNIQQVDHSIEESKMPPSMFKFYSFYDKSPEKFDPSIYDVETFAKKFANISINHVQAKEEFEEIQFFYSFPPQQSNSKSVQVEDVDKKIQSLHSLAAKFVGLEQSSEKDGVLVFDINLTRAIKAVTEKLTNLFNDVLNYGNEDILPVELIKTFIEKHGFTGKIDVKQFSTLITMFTQWKTESDGSKVIFKNTGKLDVLPLIDYYNSCTSIPLNAIEDGCLKTGTIIGTTEQHELIIRLNEWTEKYGEFDRKLRAYYATFDETSTSYLAHPVSELFIGDLTLYWDIKNERFLRCIVTGIESSRDVVIYSIDEGFILKTSPSKLFPIPHKFRKYEPFCLSFEMCKENMAKFESSEKNIYLTAAEVYINKGSVCQFKFLGSEGRSFIPNLFYGAWTQ